MRLAAGCRSRRTPRISTSLAREAARRKSCGIVARKRPRPAQPVERNLAIVDAAEEDLARAGAARSRAVEARSGRNRSAPNRDRFGRTSGSANLGNGHIVSPG
jgi:hypothetical protein